MTREAKIREFYPGSESQLGKDILYLLRILDQARRDVENQKESAVSYEMDATAAREQRDEARRERDYSQKVAADMVGRVAMAESSMKKTERERAEANQQRYNRLLEPIEKERNEALEALRRANELIGAEAQSAQEVVRGLEARLIELMASVKELVAAMRDYEMDVDDSPPFKHKSMMERADAALQEPTK